MKDILFHPTQAVLDLGVNIHTIQVHGLHNRKTTLELDNYIFQELEKIKAIWRGKTYKESAILQGFRELHTKVGRSNRDYPASPEVLLRNFLERGRFPRINAIVDIYNLISLQTQLALGAHDMKYIQGNVTLRVTTGTENFLPLGKSSLVSVPTGEYAYCDDGNNIICRLEVLQVEPTKIIESTTDAFFIIQGNQYTTKEYLKDASEKLQKLLKKFC